MGPRGGSRRFFEPAHHERDGGGAEPLVWLGARGGVGCAPMVGCCWVPAADAGMSVGSAEVKWVLGNRTRAEVEIPRRTSR